MIYKESVISILENRQKETCPVGLYSRNKADDIDTRGQFYAFSQDEYAMDEDWY